MTDRGLLALARHEGIVPAPYLDVKRVWTFGVGHTAAAGAPDPARMPRGMPADLDAGIREALRLFRADLARYEAEVLRAVTVPLAPHEFDALVSFHYNTGAIARAALTRALNAGDRAGAGAAFMNWLRPASLRPRREAERDLFLHGRYPEGPIPVWAADADGRVDFSRPVRRLSATEALALLRPAARRRAARSQVASAARPAAGSPRCSLPSPPPSNGADPMRYVLPKSLTWWAGLAAILIGLAALALPEHGPLGELAGVIAKLIGANDAAPATLITLGLGLIGLRDRLERATPQRREAMKTLSAAPAGASRQRHDDARLVLAHRARRRRRLRLHRPRPAARRSAASPTSPSPASPPRRSAAAPTSRSTRRRPRAC